MSRVWISPLLLAIACASSAAEPPKVAPQQVASRPEASEEVLRGERLLVNGRVSEARRIFEQALADNEEYARAWLDLGLTHEAAGNLRAARDAYQRATEVDPAIAEAFNNLGVLERESGELDRAVLTLERAVELDPDLTAARFNLGLCYEELSRIEDAEREYQATIEQTPGDPVPRINLAMMYLAVDRPEDAATQLRASVPRVRGDVLLSIAVGEGLRRAGLAEEAVPVLRDALEVAGDPPPTELLAELALAEYAAGDLGAAERAMARAVQQNELDPALHYAYGSILAKQGKIGEARKHLRRVEALDPDGPYAARARQRLEMIK